MRMLILGGTLFLGRAIVDDALAAGYEITLFNRGRTNPGLYPDLENLEGDRDGDLQVLRGRSFDAVVDTSGYFPRQVRTVVDVLEGNVGHYTFVSTVDVYADHSISGADETASLAGVTDLSNEDLDDNYGGFKALCETALDQVLPGRVHHVRSGLIVGPNDDTDRFTYWVRRMAAGGAVLAPGPRDQAVQFIDVRDLSRWILRALKQNVTGPVNAISTPGSMTIESVLSEIKAGAEEGAELTWVGEEFLVQREVKPWNELPLWAPTKSFPSHAGYLTRSNSRAIEHGLELRPLAETIAAIQTALANRKPGTHEHSADTEPSSLRPEREAELLSEWETTRST